VIRPGLAAAALASAACAPAPAPPASPAGNLVGEWTVVAVNGRASLGTASIRPPIYRFNFGCNDGRGNARVERDRLVVVMSMAVTERGCMNPDGSPAESMLREDEGFRIAGRSAAATFFGQDYLRLSNEAGTIDLRR
jgi:hypothetical protein